MHVVRILLFWAAVLFAVTMAVIDPPSILPGDPSVRVQHVGAFVVLSLLAAWAFPRRPLPVLFVGLVALSGLIELVQAIPSLGRVSEWTDWASDSAAVALTLFVVSALRHVRAKDKAPPVSD